MYAYLCMYMYTYVYMYMCVYSYTHTPFPKVLKASISRGKNFIIPASKGTKNLKRIKET